MTENFKLGDRVKINDNADGYSEYLWNQTGKLIKEEIIAFRTEFLLQFDKPIIRRVWVFPDDIQKILNAPDKSGASIGV